MATNFSPSSLQFSPISPNLFFKFTHISSLSSTNFNFAGKPCRLELRAAASTRAAGKYSGSYHGGEEEELVRTLMRCFNSDKNSLVSTLNKYVKVVRSEHCFHLFEELGKTDKWLQCLEVFRWMKKQRWYIEDNGVYSKLISLMGKKGQTRMAMWLFSEMRKSGCRPDTSVYNAVMTAHLHSREKAKALAKSLEYFEKMKGMERCKPNIVTYNILLRASAQAKNVAQVETLFKNLEESAIAPDIFTFNGVMAAYGKHGMIREMEGILARLKSNKLKPDIITFNLLIDSYGKKQEFEKMEQVFESLVGSKEKPTLPTFNSMITNYGKARRREKSELTFEKMKEMGYTPNVITYECLIIMYGCCDCVSKAREIFDKMVDSEPVMKTSTLNSMLEVYFRNDLPLEADTLFETAHSSKIFRLDTSTYKLLYKAHTKANKKELVEKLVKHMDREGIVLNKKFFIDALEEVGASRSKSTSVSTNKRPNNRPANAFVSTKNRPSNRPANAAKV